MRGNLAIPLEKKPKGLGPNSDRPSQIKLGEREVRSRKPVRFV